MSGGAKGCESTILLSKLEVWRDGMLIDLQGGLSHWFLFVLGKGWLHVKVFYFFIFNAAILDVAVEGLKTRQRDHLQAKLDHYNMLTRK